MSPQSRRFILSVQALLFAFLASGQENEILISGKVTDNDSSPLPGITVYLEGTQNGTVTDVNGKYSLLVEPGEIQLVVRGLGFQPERMKISISENEQLKVNFVLQEDQTELGEIQITGKTDAQVLRETAYKVDVLEAAKYQNLSVDLNQLLKGTAGLNIRETGGLGSGFSLSLNGLTGNQVRYFIDGIPMENFGSSLSLNNFPVNLIKNIEVYKGVVPVSLGADALGGAINITTGSRQISFLDAAYTIGSFNTHRASLNGQYTDSEKEFFLRLSSFFNHSDNDYRMQSVPLYDLELGNFLGDISTNRFHSEYTSGMAKLEVGLLNKRLADELSIGLTYSENRNNFQHPDNNIKRVFGSFHTTNETLMLSSIYRKKIGSLDLESYILGGKIQQRVVDTSSYKYNWAGGRIERVENDMKGELNDRRSLLELSDNIFRTSITAEYDIDLNNRFSTNFSQNYLSRSGKDLVNEFNNSYSSPSHLNKMVAGGAYSFTPDSGKWEASVFGKQYWYSGTIISTDYLDNTLKNELNLSNTGFGFTATYWPINKIQVKASFEKAYRMPESYEILGDGIYVSPNPQLNPEKSYNGNLGAVYKNMVADLKFNVETNVFLRASQNFIRFRPLGPFGQYENLNNVRTEGIETAVELSFKDRINLAVNGTWQNLTDQTKTDEGLPNVNYQSRIPNVPYLFGNARLGFRPFQSVFGGNMQFYWNTRYVHEFFLTWENLGSEANKNVIPAQLTHDLEVEYSIMNGRYNLSLSINNLTNEEVYDNFRIQKPGRAFYLKFRYLLR
ncbi:TonB-dependent receptor [Salinimicrobium terrae]|uniref:TonB-dependent receptor n=1 Tax=Salinimicrobium terrae TaxID=470866 RepID=UPI0003F85898|nr:TonB-dependent receptor [Salinimicrobium terrae]